MEPEVEFVTIDETNLDRLGFFCYKSKRKSEGYAKKLAWARKRLSKGMRLHIVYEDGVSKGFVEAIPGEYAWRAVNARGYLFIHCIWVVGKAKGKGFGARLLEKCSQDASDLGLNGLAVLASEETWLTERAFFQNAGFEITGMAEPAFSLMAFGSDVETRPSMPLDWQDRRAAFGPDLTVVYTNQCPYIDRMKQAVHNVADSLGIPSREVYIASASEVQTKAPSPYGVYNIVFRGELVAAHPVGTDELLKRMKNRV